MFSIHRNTIRRFKPVIVKHSQEETVCLIIRPLMILDLTDSVSLTDGIVLIPEREIYSVEIMLYFSCLNFFE